MNYPDMMRRGLTLGAALALSHWSMADPVATTSTSSGVTFAQIAAAPASPAKTSATVTPAPATQASSVSTTAAPVVPTAPAPMTLAERQAQDLLANAKRLDSSNRELLADKQKQALQLEQLQTQVSALRADRSNEGIREGAGAVVVGFLLGWFFAGRRRKSW